MAQLSAAQLVQLDEQAGFGPAAAAVMAAIQLAEDSGVYGNLADIQRALTGLLSPGSYPGLAYWPHGSAAGGPEVSIGISQINYPAHPKDFAGQPTDPVRLMTDPLYNAREAYYLSGGGSNFGAWSTYSSRAYQRYLPETQAAAGGPQATPASLPLWLPPPFGGLPTPGDFGLHLPSGLGGDISKGVIGGVGNLLSPIGPLVVRGALVFFGLVFVIVGLVILGHSDEAAGPGAGPDRPPPPPAPRRGRAVRAAETAAEA